LGKWAATIAGCDLRLSWPAEVEGRDLWPRMCVGGGCFGPRLGDTDRAQVWVLIEARGGGVVREGGACGGAQPRLAWQ
jgi:hypothetical protein